MTRLKGDRSEGLPSRARWWMVLHEVIFEADTPAGKGFDVLLIVSILASDEFPACQCEPTIQGFCQANVYGIIHQANPGIVKREDDLARVVRGAIVNDPELIIRPCLAQNRQDGIMEIISAIKNRHQHAYSGMSSGYHCCVPKA